MQFQNTLSFAQQLDTSDPLKSYRDKFVIPEAKGKQKIYFLGNSLGLQPKSTNDYIQRIMQDWADLGVESFFHAREPWMNYHDQLIHPLSKIVGALPHEVVVMNQLTVNLHLMMVSFYRPSATRYKIICEAKAFPSDQYTFETHVRHHNFDPALAIVEVSPRPGEHTITTEDILSAIEKNGQSTALVLFGGINYYTGQLFDMAAITKAAQSVGAKVGFAVVGVDVGVKVGAKVGLAVVGVNVGLVGAKVGAADVGATVGEGVTVEVYGRTIPLA